MKTKNLPVEEFDLVFVGMGAANSLLFMRLANSGALLKKRIAIIEPDHKLNNDRTFCFWSYEKEIKRFNLDHLISHSWSKCTSATRLNESIAPYKYYHISGIELYQKTKSVIDQFPVEYFRENLNNQQLISPTIPELSEIPNPQNHPKRYPSANSSNSIFIQLENTIISSKWAFDSRPPTFNPPRKNEVSLVQSFWGWVIETENNCFDSDTFVMMDFNIHQNNSTQFLYILPYSSNQALVELTAFSSESIQKTYAENLLSTEIQSRYGTHKIISTETGNIPMSTAQISQASNLSAYFPTGARAGNIKPSTGYSFLKSCQHAIEIEKQLFSEHQRTTPKNLNRFTFYDRLLLSILKKHPKKGKNIFEALFKSNPTAKVIRFLREETVGLNEIKLLSSLPIQMFLIAAIHDIFHRIPWKMLIPFVAAITLWSLNSLHFSGISQGLLILGFLFIGIPHGAVDHLFDSKQLDSPITVPFIAGYVFKMIVMGVIWWINPIFALIVFILSSAWHFGEAEFKRSTMVSFLWGLSLLGIFLFSHPTELNSILSEMSILPLNMNFNAALGISVIAITIAQISRGFLTLLELAWILIAIRLPLIEGFGTYFIFSHSLQSSVDIFQKHAGSTSKLLQKATPFSLGAFLLLGILYYINIWETDGFGGYLFIFISCISFPHVFAMHKFYHNTKRTRLLDFEYSLDSKK
jgi:lycopene beta-cyclase